MSGSKSRRKGHDFERTLVELFSKAMPGAKIRRGFQYRNGEESPDVDCPVFWIEAKCGRKPNVRAALRQAYEAAPMGRMPLAVVRDDRKGAFVSMALNDFLEIVSEWWEGVSR